MKKIILIISFIILVYQSAFSEYYKYFPLKIGNIFVYQYTYTNPSGTTNTRRTMKIVRDTIIEQKKYYYVQGVFNDWLRLDSFDGNLYAFDSIGCRQYSHEILIDSLLVDKSQFSNSCWFNTYSVCLDTNTSSIFGIQTKLKKLYYGIGGGPGFYSNTRHYSEKFGLYSITTNSGGSGFYASSNLSLTGCVIDNIVYGDTNSSSTNITNISNIAHDYQLSQNFPNPFNPSTKIKFQIPKSSFVSLKIYDLIGREVETLVSENLNTGEYQVQWNASNFPSGVYFYKLQTDNLTETKKMLLVK
ncbi:MAG TPA: T9SS type A sorting domain-containing protein [Ignavibacteria bacterium]|nr:T9SS type A sorting domain-containing protein [Ignavibacteria bacterium]